jgi:hypothetical protein
VAHGGLAGAVVEALVALAIIGLLLAVWLRERRRGDEPEVEEDGRDGDGWGERPDP